MFEFVRTIAFRTFGSINIADKGSVPLSPTILVLENFRIYVGVLNSSEMSSDIE